MTCTFRFAVVDSSTRTITSILGSFEPGSAGATAGGLHALVVCLDENEDDMIAIGDVVAIDDEGVARLANELGFVCDVCGARRVDVLSIGRDANGDPDAPDVCKGCRSEGES